MNDLSVTKRYARALYEAAESRKETQQLKDDMLVLRKLFEEAPEIATYCARVSTPDAKHSSRILLETAFLPYLSSLSGTAATVMEKHGRLAILPYLPQVIFDFFDRDAGIIPVHIESASELEEPDRARIMDRLRDRIGSKIRVSWAVRPGLIGGMTIQWDNLFLDVSLRGRFDNLKRQLRGIADER